MSKRLKLRLPAWVAILIFCVSVVISCSSPTKRRGVKLSEATEEAKKPPAEQTPIRERERSDKIRGEDDPDDETEVNVDMAYVDEPEPPLMSGESMYMTGADDELASPEMVNDFDELGSFHFGLILGGGTIAGDNYDGFGMFAVEGGTFNRSLKTYFSLALVGMTVNLTETSPLVDAVKDEWEGAFDISARYYVTPSHTFTGLYGLGGVRFGYLFWRYANPIEVETDVGVETISSDHIGFFAPYVGVGTSLVQVSWFRFGVNASVGVNLYSGVTNEGFDNDIFSSDPFFQVMVPVAFGRF